MDVYSETIDKIVSVAKEKLDEAGIRQIDSIAKHYCDLLEELDEEEAMMEVYNYYTGEED